MQLCFVSAIYTLLSFKARRAIFLAGFLSNSIVADGSARSFTLFPFHDEAAENYVLLSVRQRGQEVTNRNSHR